MSQIKMGAVLSYLYIALGMIITLVYTPLIIRFLGRAEYGLYEMIGSLAAYFSIMDMGLGNAVVRYTSKNRALGDTDGQARLNGLFLCLFSCIGILAFFVGLYVYQSVEVVFSKGLTVDELATARTMIAILTINFSLSFPLAVFGSYLAAYEKFITIKLISIIRVVITPLFILPLLYFGYGSVSMVIISSVINILCLLYNVYYCMVKLNMKIKFAKVKVAFLKELLVYSFFIFLGVIVDQIYWNTGQIVLGIFKNTSSVAILAIALQLTRVYLSFSTAISGLFLPKISMMVAQQATNKQLSEVMIKVGRIQFCIMAFVLSGFILVGKQFITLWVGSSYSSAYYMVLVMMIPLTVPLIQNVGLSILQAKNMQKFRSVVLLAMAIVNLVLSIVLVDKYGPIGIVSVSGAAFLIGNGFIMNIYYAKRINIDISLFWRNICKLIIPFCVATIIAAGSLLLISIDRYINLFLFIIFYCVLYGGLFWFLGLENYEKLMLKKACKGIISVTHLRPKYSGGEDQ